MSKIIAFILAARLVAAFAGSVLAMEHHNWAKKEIKEVESFTKKKREK